jgi:hypothetical protein
MTNPSFVNRVETLPPIGASDHDIVYSEINLALPQNKQIGRASCSQSMWPRLKSPLTQMLEFVFLHKTLFSEIPSCSNDSPLSDGGR